MRPIRHGSRIVLGLALAALAVGLRPLSPVIGAQGSGLRWQFDLVEALPQQFDCLPSVTPDGFRIDPSGGLVVAWRESGCALPPYDAKHTGFRWAKRDTQTLAWTFNTIVDEMCTSLFCRGLRAEPPALAVRPDGAPFYLYGREGEFEWIRVATINLAENPTGANPALGEWLAQYQSSLSHPMLAADFPANANNQATPNYIRASRGGSPLTLNGAQIESGGFDAIDYAAGPSGQHHVLLHGSTGGPTSYYYSNGTAGAATAIAPLANSPDSNGLSVRADANNRIHLAVTGTAGDVNWYWSTLAYLWSDDNGATWAKTVVVDGTTSSNRAPSLALDSHGLPAIAYWRDPDQIRLARFDGVTWHDSLVTTTGSQFGSIAAPKLAFDAWDRPIVFFYHEGTQALMTATADAGAADDSLAVGIAGSGSGTVTSTPAGIACPGSCVTMFPKNSFVTLVATPAAGSTFVGWLGACTGTGPCVLPISGSMTAAARFDAPAPRHQIVVTTTAQTGGAGDCTLGDAIRAANLDQPVNGCAAGSGADAIVLPAGTYTLTSPVQTNQGDAGLPAIQSDILIQGAGAGSTIIERDANAPAFRIFYVDYSPPGPLTLNDVTVRNGRTDGAALLKNGGPVVINRCTFVTNDAGGGEGGAINNRAGYGRDGGRLQITDSIFDHNHASHGGAISGGGPLIVVNSQFTANAANGNGGAIAPSGTVTIVGSQFVANSAKYSGGGIYSGGTLTISRSTFDANVLDSISGGSGGAIFAAGSLTVLHSTLTNNQSLHGHGGGAIANNGVASIIGSTLSGNQTDNGGGAIMSSAQLTVTNSTISGNSASAFGGGLVSFQGPLSLTNVTITNNDAPAGWASGLFNNGGATMRNTILSGNTSSSPGMIDCWSNSGSFPSNGHNIVGQPGNCFAAPGAGDLLGVDPQIGPLADNGGPTKTHAPLPSSPAIDAGNPSDPNGGDPDACATDDQRGKTRPFGAACDVGAVEYIPRATLTVAKDGSGTGSVSSDDGRINCGDGACSAEYDAGSVVTLTASPSQASTFDSWAGCDEVTGAQCTVVLAASRTVTARFTAPAADLAVSLTGPTGSGVAGQPLHFSFSVTNNGPAAATSVKTTLAFGAGVSISAQSSGCNPVGGAVLCFIGSLSSGGVATFDATVTAVTAGALTAQLSLTEDQSDPSPENNTAQTVVQIEPAQIALAIEERVTVSDAVLAVPSVVLSIDEHIGLVDLLGYQKAVMLDVDEHIGVNDSLSVENTATGTNVVVQPVDPTGGLETATVTFANVTQTGSTTVTAVTAPALPPEFQFGTPPLLLDISTTAIYAGTVTVCINYSGVTFSNAGALRLLHFENGAWVDRTVSLDANAHLVCGVVSSLSPFAVAQAVPTTAVPGRMHGEGHVAGGGLRHHFEFSVTEKRNGVDHGNVELWVRAPDTSRSRGRELHRFNAARITVVQFADNPAFTPGRRSKPAIDSVAFSGIGRWDGMPGYTFEARATDEGEPGAGRDTFAITIRDPRGAIVASIGGTLAAGNIQSLRLER